MKDMCTYNTIIELLPDAEVLVHEVSFSSYWDTHILCLCSFHFWGCLTVVVYVMHASSKIDIAIPYSSDPPHHEFVN